MTSRRMKNFLSPIFALLNDSNYTKVSSSIILSGSSSLRRSSLGLQMIQICPIASKH